MDSDQGKLFIGGISWDTNEDKLRDYFGNYGDVCHASVMRDKNTGKPRGFAFVVFSDPSVIDRVLEDTHVIDGRTVDAKRALSREDQQVSFNSRSGNSNSARNSGNGGNIRTKKIFVGGLPPTLTEEKFREYFEAYGQITDVVVMYDQNTGRPRGFGFISFDNEDAVDSVLYKTFHELSGKNVEVKRALPKDANPGASNRIGGAECGGYLGYGASGGNQNAYDGRIDSSRYMQPQNNASGFPPYGSSGYTAPGYGYGAANNGIGYGAANNGIGYGAYGGYSGATAGYGGPAGASYGNPNAANAAYAGGPPGGPRSSWSAQAPSGYGSAGYGSTAPWGAPSGGAGTGSGGPGSAPSGQSLSAVAGYGNQGYGYGGSDSSYGNPGAFGAVGGRSGSAPNSELQGSGGSYVGSGYSDSNGNSGYGNYGTRPGNGAVHAGQGGYGGGYGDVQSRHAQQM
ncbi:PREDICTED: heterogeneous nuclear ribonucleoprotein 1-like [Lupinus angustifolius]|uniref:heterogeneous nuclear ribonucleoprotein 1-like n=1 Tax=Lupinus angustifolius TaxID=3871 RepID=UPI00092FAF4A|nr:PREDICTED: heterogeneous nuclear ribonucleoprotein 1-like [Lupinus angustifolius]